MDCIMSTTNVSTIPTRDDTKARLLAIEPRLRANGVTSLTLFGSVARDEADEESDVDLTFTYQGDFGMLTWGSVIRQIQDALGRKADVVPRSSIKATVWRTAQNDAFQIF